MATDQGSHSAEDEFEADVRDLFQERARADERFRSRLYASLCNIEWQRERVGYSVTWRGASTLVCQLVGGMHDLDLYLSGGEGIVDPEVAQALGERGWKPETDPTKSLRVPR